MFRGGGAVPTLSHALLQELLAAALHCTAAFLISVVLISQRFMGCRVCVCTAGNVHELQHLKSCCWTLSRTQAMFSTATALIAVRVVG